jgi:MarR family 2-MHQ and catechol resistance regulon transcriptional repressor
MGIEKDINQSKFKNEYHKLIVNLIYTYNWVNEQTKEVLENWDLTSQQFNILRILRGSHGPLSTLQIRERMLDKMSDTSRIVDRLLIKGLVKKVACKADKRLVDITITPKGQKLLSAIDKEEEKLDNIAKMLSVADAKLLSKLLDKMRGSN